MCQVIQPFDESTCAASSRSLLRAVWAALLTELWATPSTTISPWVDTMPVAVVPAWLRCSSVPGTDQPGGHQLGQFGFLGAAPAVGSGTRRDGAIGSADRDLVLVLVRQVRGLVHVEPGKPDRRQYRAEKLVQAAV